MPTILGSGEHRYRVVEGWAKLPDGWELTDVASVAVDSKDRVYVFNRGAHPMIVFDRDGNFLRSWGEGLFSRAHGLNLDADDNLYCTDDGDHTVRKCTSDGKVLLTIGIPEKPAPFMSGEPFHRCTHTALSPQGEIYVSDGYGNARVHKFTPEGKLIKSWGEPGSDPGQFNIVHKSRPMPTAMSMSPTARTTACRCSTAAANTSRSGTICIAPVRYAAVAAASSRGFSSASSAQAWQSTARCPISARA
jgi:NHL repeat